MTAEAPKKSDRLKKLNEDLIQSILENATVDVPPVNGVVLGNKTSKASATQFGTDLDRQDKTPRDLRDKTFVVTEDQPE